MPPVRLRHWPIRHTDAASPRLPQVGAVAVDGAADRLCVTRTVTGLVEALAHRRERQRQHSEAAASWAPAAAPIDLGLSSCSRWFL
jgi:hypothetical protein